MNLCEARAALLPSEGTLSTHAGVLAVLAAGTASTHEPIRGARLREARAVLLGGRREEARDGAAELGPHARVEDRAVRFHLGVLGVLTYLYT